MDIVLILKIFLLSFIQGISEFFPISSSGHLVIFQEILNFDKIPLIYDIFFHIGTLISVIIFFFKDIKELTLHFYKEENFKFIVLIIIASIPTAIIAILFRKPFEGMFDKPEMVGYFFLLTALILILSKYFRINKMNLYLTAFLIGTIQGIAIIPGLSRSGLTISAGLILSMGFLFSFKFSFLLSIPAITGALILEISKIPFETTQIFYLLSGALFSALFGFAALALLKQVILAELLRYCAFYCFFAGVSAIIFI